MFRIGKHLVGRKKAVKKRGQSFEFRGRKEEEEEEGRGEEAHGVVWLFSTTNFSQKLFQACMSQALMFLGDFKLGHYMKIPPKSMFIVQLAGTVAASSVYFATSWWLLHSIENIWDVSLLPEGSPWTCPGDDVFYNGSIIWGVVGPLRMFTKKGIYPELNWFFLINLIAPVPSWFFAKKFPNQKWIRLINMPIILGATGKFKGWWARHNYILSAALDAGVAFTGVLLYLTLQSKDIFGPDWWGLLADDHCPLAACPTAPGDGYPYGVVSFTLLRAKNPELLVSLLLKPGRAVNKGFDCSIAMAERMRFLVSWIEVAPALLIRPNKTSASPELETITEEWELEAEDHDQKSGAN
ncbi:hypothetical protein ACLB2K_060253 [Fragaria x ananassa]